MDAFFDVIIVAGGVSERFGANKLLFPIGSRSIIAKTVAAFVDCDGVNNIIVVINANDAAKMQEELAVFSNKIIFTTGDITRTQSVENGLALVTTPTVLIHDAARPFVTQQVINNVAMATKTFGSAIPAIPITDSVRCVKDGAIVDFSIDRSEVFTVQTPQGFDTAKLRKAFSLRNGKNYTDESALYAEKIGAIKIVNGDIDNRKITHLSDCYGINAKVGIGYDIHKLVPHRKLILGGIELESELGSLAHSDGDAIIHALIDALLSAIGELDIGSHFPDTDPKYDCIDSAIMLTDTMALVNATNLKINNVSIIVILDTPKLQDHILVMRIKLANLLGIPYQNIAISAKTTENTAPYTVTAYATVTLN